MKSSDDNMCYKMKKTHNDKKNEYIDENFLPSKKLINLIKLDILYNNHF